MNLKKTHAKLGPLPLKLALVGVVPSALAALALLSTIGKGWGHILIEHRGLLAALIIHDQWLIAAQLGPTGDATCACAGRFEWTGRNALKAIAILLNRPVAVEFIATDEPLLNHAVNLEHSSLCAAMLEIAVCIDEDTPIESVPATFLPGTGACGKCAA